MPRLSTLLLGLLCSACTSSHTFRWEGSGIGSVTLIREATGEAVLGVGSGATGSELYPGELVHVSFLGTDASLLSTEHLLADGDAVSVPFGARDALVALDPPRDYGRFSWGGSWTKPTPFSFRALSLEPVGGRYVRLVDFRALATSRPEADALALAFLRQGFRDAPPAGVSVGTYVFVTLATRNAYVSLATIPGPTWASLQVDAYSHAGLQGISLQHVGPWTLVTFPVPLADLNYRRAYGGQVLGQLAMLRADGGALDGRLHLQVGP